MGHLPPADSATNEMTFEAVAAAHYPSLVQRLVFIVRDHAEAEDLAQATLLRAYEAWDRFDGVSDPGPWLRTIGTRLALNERRRRLRRPWSRLTVDEASETNTNLDLWMALAALRKEERAALVMNVLEGYTQAEIAALLEVPQGTVASWVSRAKYHLRDMLENEGVQR